MWKGFFLPQFKERPKDWEHKMKGWFSYQENRKCCTEVAGKQESSECKEPEPNTEERVTESAAAVSCSGGRGRSFGSQAQISDSLTD